SQMRIALLDYLAKKDPHHTLEHFLDDCIKKTLQNDTTYLRYTSKTKTNLAKLFESLFSISISSTMEDLALSLEQNGISELKQFFMHLHQLRSMMGSDRASLLQEIKKILEPLDSLTEQVFHFLRKGQNALLLKISLWGHSSRWVTRETTLTRLQDLFSSSTTPLPVVLLTDEGNLFPIGCVEKDRAMIACGTVSLRDFSNRLEANISHELEIISVIDHHKTSIQTTTPSLLYIADVQACSVLLSELENQSLQQYGKMEEYTVAPERKLLFAFSILAAIFDDTDLLAKAKIRDFTAVCALLSELSHEHLSWSAGASLDEIRQMLLGSSHAFEIYSKFFALREENMKKSIEKAAQKESFELFSDSKGTRVLIGQTKLFLNNWPQLRSLRSQLLQQWLRFGQSKGDHLLFFSHVMSTICSAEQVIKGTPHPKDHKDQLWLAGKSEKMIDQFVKKILEHELASNEVEIELISGDDHLKENKQLTTTCSKFTQNHIDGITQPVLVLHFPF
uniref:hypothetical protein n=1 Tax=Candidatus Similichlamydia epinepheli TaxID=1903953 RepID=UPI001300B384